MTINLLFCGDIVGRSGRDVVLEHIPQLRKELALDFVIVNGENAAAGFGITPDICKDLFKAGVDVITGGNHIWDQKEIIPTLAQDKRVLRPHNFPSSTPGTGYGVYETQRGHKIAVLQVLGQVFHPEYAGCPFATADEAFKNETLGKTIHAAIVDVHMETTSEKQAMAHYLDGRVSAVVGTHTHVPTADGRIFPKGTAYQTDLGMCGDYNSVLGFKPAAPIERFLTKIRKAKMETATGPGTLFGALLKIDETTGKTLEITPVRRGATW
jgi:2',3'-cyclic-nucleotide 2'-phosphodiesterase